MDATRIIGLFFLTFSFVLLSGQIVFDDPTNFVCPLEDHPKQDDDGKLVHNITRTDKCFNGKHMAGCCVPRIYCDFNTSHTDLSLYGPPGFRMPCRDVTDKNNKVVMITVCCPLNYILPIPLPKTSNTTDDSSSSGSMNVSDNTVD